MSAVFNDDIVRLNRLYFLCQRAKGISKPYRIARIRQLYEESLFQIERKESIVKIDADNYSLLFEKNSSLEEISMRKMAAITNGDYERASHFRDLEKRKLRELLTTIGVNENSVFFVRDHKLFKYLD